MRDEHFEQKIKPHALRTVNDNNNDEKSIRRHKDENQVPLVRLSDSSLIERRNAETHRQ